MSENCEEQLARLTAVNAALREALRNLREAYRPYREDMLSVAFAADDILCTPNPRADALLRVFRAARVLRTDEYADLDDPKFLVNWKVLADALAAYAALDADSTDGAEESSSGASPSEPPATYKDSESRYNLVAGWLAEIAPAYHYAQVILKSHPNVPFANCPVDMFCTVTRAVLADFTDVGEDS